MSTRAKRKSFAERCINDHKQQIAREIRKIAKDNDWLCKEVSEHTKTSISSVSYVLRGDEQLVSLERLCLMAYELGIAVNLKLILPN